VADEHKETWWKSVPGLLTAGTGFVAALSGLVAGLNQLGVFRRDQSAAPVQVVAPAPPETIVRPPSVSSAGGSSSSTAAPAPASSPGSSAPLTTAPSGSSARPTAPSGARSPMPAPASRPATAHDSSATNGSAANSSAAAVLPKGTTLELTVPTRTCAPAKGQERFTARLASPVRVAGTTVLAAGTAAVLHLRRADGDGPEVRLDSLVPPGQAIAVPASAVQIRRGGAAGCLRADAKLTATLGAALTLPPR
jgi:hypothetical protein